MSKRKTSALAVLVCSLLLASVALVISSADYAIDWATIAGGGGHAETGAYALDATLGQAVVGVSSGPSNVLCAGFGCGTEREAATPRPTATVTPTITPSAHPVYLSLVLRNPVR